MRCRWIWGLGLCLAAAGCFEEADPIGDGGTADAGADGPTGADSDGGSDVDQPDGTEASSEGPAATTGSPADPLSLFTVACDPNETVWDAANADGEIQPAQCGPMPGPGTVTPIEAFDIDGRTAPALQLVPLDRGDIAGAFERVDTTAFIEPELVVELACPPSIACRFDYDVAVYAVGSENREGERVGSFVAADGVTELRLPIDLDERVDIVFTVFFVSGVMPPMEHAMLVDPRVVDAAGS